MRCKLKEIISVAAAVTAAAGVAVVGVADGAVSLVRSVHRLVNLSSLAFIVVSFASMAGFLVSLSG